jgi:hypothetical protein
MALSLLMLLTLFLKLKAKMFLANETTQHAFRLYQHKSNDSNKNQSSFAPKNDKPFTLLTQNKITLITQIPYKQYPPHPDTI